MSLSDLAAIGGFVSGIAVVVTLVFLLLQMRQTNLNQRALMQQMRSARSIDTILRQAESYPSEILCRAWRNDPKMEEAEIRSFLHSMEAALFNWEDSFLQHRAGTLDAERFESDLNAFRHFISTPAFRVAWRFNRHFFGTEFRELGDSIMRDTRVTQPQPLKPLWATMMAEEQPNAA